jgi:glycosyltransferase involved in cell wall biosynthesis
MPKAIWTFKDMQNTLSLVIPVYNEALRLKITFQALEAKLGCPGFKLKEIIFINDGSTDETVKVLRQWREISPQKQIIKIVSYRVNRGKGYAVKRGFQAATSDYVLMLDVDMSTPLSQLKRMLRAVNRGNQVIIGTRKNGHSTVVIPQPLYRQILGRGFTLIAQLILNTWVTDFTCGFKLFSKAAYQKIGQMMQIDRWGYDAEVVYLAKKYGFKLAEVPVKWYNDRRTRVKVSLDIAQSLVDLMAIRKNDGVGAYEMEGKRVTLVGRMLAWIAETS